MIVLWYLVINELQYCKAECNMLEHKHGRVKHHKNLNKYLVIIGCIYYFFQALKVILTQNSITIKLVLKIVRCKENFKILMVNCFNNI